MNEAKLNLNTFCWLFFQSRSGGLTSVSSVTTAHGTWTGSVLDKTCTRAATAAGRTHLRSSPRESRAGTTKWKSTQTTESTDTGIEDAGLRQLNPTK